MKCKCGVEVLEGSKFCPECGSKLPKPKAPVPKIADELVIDKVPPVINAKETAILLRISLWMVYELVKQEKIPYFTVGKRKLFRTQELLAWAGTQDEITTAG
ncbi:hypothetical protein JCM14036_30380 [Desulfotomaculum defluvii]